jgi:hypothetical protein
MKFGVLTRPFGLAVAVTLAVLLAAPAAAQNGDRDRGDYQGRWDSQGRANRQRGYERSPQWHGWHSYRGYGNHDNSGAIVGGALLGLGVGAATGGILLAPPPVVYVPAPPRYYNYNYGPPPYAYPYAPPPVYYGE